MRRLWTFIIAGAAIALSADAVDAQISIGAKGGISFSDVSLDPEDGLETSSITGFAGGGEVTIPLGASGFSIQPEVLYVRKGAEVPIAIDNVVVTAKNKVDYIEIPLLLRYNIPAQSVTPFLYAGGAVAFEASCKVEAEALGVSAEADCEDADVETESTDFGVMFGGGIAFPAGPGDIFVEGRYNIGLVDVEPSDVVEAKNRSGAVMIGYSVSLDPTSR